MTSLDGRHRPEGEAPRPGRPWRRDGWGRKWRCRWTWCASSLARSSRAPRASCMGRGPRMTRMGTPWPGQPRGRGRRWRRRNYAGPRQRRRQAGLGALGPPNPSPWHVRGGGRLTPRIACRNRSGRVGWRWRRLDPSRDEAVFARQEESSRSRDIYCYSCIASEMNTGAWFTIWRWKLFLPTWTASLCAVGTNFHL